MYDQLPRGMMVSEIKQAKVNRRDFLKTTGLAAAAVASSSPVSAQGKPQSSIYDVAILGDGFCGVTAARECMKMATTP